MPRISSERRVTLPLEALEQSGLGRGDEVTIEADGTGRIALRRADLTAGVGVFDGLYEPGYLDSLRAGNWS